MTLMLQLKCNILFYIVNVYRFLTAAAIQATVKSPEISLFEVTVILAPVDPTFTPDTTTETKKPCQ